MIDKKKVEAIVNEYLEGSDQFLVKVSVSPQNKVSVFLDGDTGVKIEDCIQLSRHIESFFDRDREDFELEVSTVGVGTPLTQLRQYRNNKGRNIAVLDTENKKTRGKLLDATSEGITLEKEPPKSGKKKKPKQSKVPEEDKKVFFAFDQIKEAKIQVSFKKKPEK